MPFYPIRRGASRPSIVSTAARTAVEALESRTLLSSVAAPVGKPTIDEADLAQPYSLDLTDVSPGSNPVSS